MSSQRLREMGMKKVIVIGCGPSGMMAAIAAAKSGAATTVLEAGHKPGRKLLLTGNGRCNLTNTNPHIRSVYGSSNPEEAAKLVNSVFDQFSVEDTLAFFQKEGLLTVTEHGTYIYPASGQSESVLDILLRTMKNLKIKMKYNEEVVAIERTEDFPDQDKDADGRQWCVRTSTWAYYADSVILSCGSRSVPSTGSNGAGYELCRMLGIDVTDILPALTAVTCSLPEPETKAYVPGASKKQASVTNPLFAAAGTRTGALVKVCVDGEEIACEKGQVQFTNQDVSGIVIYNLSRYVSRSLHTDHVVELMIDLLPDIEQEQLEQLIIRIRKKFDGISSEGVLLGLIPSRLVPTALYMQSVTGKPISYVLKNFTLTATGLRGFDSAQVCIGGVRLTELDPDTLECCEEDRKGIYLTGELIDIDGPCGGYNLQWAWSSGYTAGLHAGKDA